MKQGLPKPVKIAGLILIIFLFVLIVLAWIYGRSASLPMPNDTSRTASTDQTIATIDVDSDHDGLKDWEEAIYHTDPHNPDTDGDGTPDGEEIKENRNPLKKGPDDTNPIAPDETNTDAVHNAYRHLQDLAGQGNISQALVYQLINQKGISSFLSTQKAKNTADDLGGYLQKLKTAPEFSPDLVADTSLAISTDTSNQAVKTYFNSLGGLYEKYIFPLQVDDLTIIQAAMSAKDKTKLQDIGALSEASNKMLQAVKKTTVPQNLLLFHKKEIYFLENTYEELNLLNTASVDDVLYMALLSNMRIQTKKMVSGFHQTEIPAWLERNHISFAPGEKAMLVYYKQP